MFIQRCSLYALCWFHAQVKAYRLRDKTAACKENDQLFASLKPFDRKCQDCVYIKWEYWSTLYNMKRYLRHGNKVNENKVSSYCKALRCETIKNNTMLFSFMSNLQTYYHFKLNFQKVDQHTGGKWLIHGTLRHKNNQLKSLELACRVF